MTRTNSRTLRAVAGQCLAQVPGALLGYRRHFRQPGLFPGACWPFKHFLGHAARGRARQSTACRARSARSHRQERPLPRPGGGAGRADRPASTASGGRGGHDHPGEFSTPVSGRVHNPGMLPRSAESPDDPLEQDAPDHQVDDPAIGSWFLAEGDRANRATDLRMFTTGNLVKPLIDGRAISADCAPNSRRPVPGDQVYTSLTSGATWTSASTGPGSEVGEILGLAARRGVSVFGLLWRSHPEGIEAVQKRPMPSSLGGSTTMAVRCCLTPGLARGGSHHQKLVVVRHPGARNATSPSSAASTLDIAAMMIRGTSVIRR